MSVCRRISPASQILPRKEKNLGSRVELLQPLGPWPSPGGSELWSWVFEAESQVPKVLEEGRLAETPVQLRD